MRAQNYPFVATPSQNNQRPAELPLTAGARVGLDASRFLHVARYTNAAGKNKTLNIPATLRSADDTQRGAVSGKILIVFPKGTNCSFSNSALDKKDPGYSALKTAVAGITVVGIPTSGSTRGFGVSIAAFSGSVAAPKPANVTAAFSVGQAVLDVAASNIRLAPGGSRAFRPRYKFASGSVDFNPCRWNRLVAGQDLSGTFGIPVTTLAALPAIRSVSPCNLALKNINNVPTFTLLCQKWRIQASGASVWLANYVGTDLTAGIAFSQSPDRTAISIKGSIPLTSAKKF
ncbi:hypothetical protein MNEG_0925 [Monoraphidium neglectum]|uniref:Uncharacterized protein n=1 Tax=Monoraphidium neglectum TaxID=145388 RepID=A0A0D2N3V6_9CHLO|nr:hypothetical protein MNEG_0925 [Monoraphidium neglectum]KIZ07032.1 hypothetical protein MNEG_0925 [Monoraphidium neglectum]|eukprot:XP_013906051.1 hypothetical protein MNEG_0925 [Monoraphidium neglectum]